LAQVVAMPMQHGSHILLSDRIENGMAKRRKIQSAEAAISSGCGKAERVSQSAESISRGPAVAGQPVLQFSLRTKGTSNVISRAF
jgi:hypothetical protein